VLYIVGSVFQRCDIFKFLFALVSFNTLPDLHGG
jgi:hypothetical protein